MEVENVNFYGLVGQSGLYCYDLQTEKGNISVLAMYYEWDRQKRIQHAVVFEGDVYMANEWKLSPNWVKPPRFEVVDGNGYIFNVRNKFDMVHLNTSFKLKSVEPKVDS